MRRVLSDPGLPAARKMRILRHILKAPGAQMP
jgi:hypothetical protein